MTALSRNRLLLAPFALVLAIAVAPRFAAGAATDDHEDSPVAQQMDLLKDNLSALGRTIGEPDKRSESLEHLQTMQLAALSAKVLVPSKEAELPEAERARFQSAFRKDMGTLIKALIDVEGLVLDGKFDEAKQAVRSDVLPLRNAGHETYKD